MKVLLLASYCDNDGCCDELPCEKCLVMCNVVEIEGCREGTYKITGSGEYAYLRAMAKEGNNLDEEEDWHRCDAVSCDSCPHEDKCLGEE